MPALRYACRFAFADGIAMSELSRKFDRAAKDAQNLKKRPADEDMLRLYALYKQVSVGDVSGDRPGAFDFVSRAKYDAWSRLKGTTQDKAMKSYIDLVERLKRLG
jgi:diazepam-binding inhibitor (GABA receptor modulating acyl-CoA-binding protein)